MAKFMVKETVNNCMWFNVKMQQYSLIGIQVFSKLNTIEKYQKHSSMRSMQLKFKKERKYVKIKNNVVICQQSLPVSANILAIFMRQSKIK